MRNGRLALRPIPIDEPVARADAERAAAAPIEKILKPTNKVQGAGGVNPLILRFSN